MTWALQPCQQTEGRQSIICDGSYVLARIPSPVWDKTRRDLDPRDRPAAVLMTAAPVLRAAVQGFVDACGGNPPDWLKAEFAAAERALQEAGGELVNDPVREALEAAEHWIEEQAWSPIAENGEILRTIRAALGREI
ncbi:hypothetical protein [Bosea massiliensis]|uniref:Uncharacterized protein n=1 Tax=Bosea massiliensis TaxID=151419 RepID=A0ABW0P9I9_9HYPH